MTIKDTSQTGTQTNPAVSWLGLVAGPLVAAVCFVAIPIEYRDAASRSVEFSSAGRATLAVMIWMGIWWMTEAIPIYATALLPIAVFPMLGVAEIKDASTPYGNPLIFLFMGGFLLALSMQRWGLGKRIALTILQIVGTRPLNMIAGFMFTTALLSAFVSNTATAAMMLPIATSVIGMVRRQDELKIQRGDSKTPIAKNFAVCLMLGIAYSASIGGLATIIGSPPNVFLVSYLSETIAEPYRSELSFTGWMMFGVPLAIVFLPIVFLLLTRVLYPVTVTAIPGGDEFLRDEMKALGRPNRGEWATFIVFIVTATLWIIRPAVASLTIGAGDSSWKPLAGLTDTGIAMLAAMILFVIPVDFKRRVFVMDWETSLKLPWGILLLFGGGLSLAAAVESNGVSEFLGSQVGFVKGMPPVAIVFFVAAGTVYLTELTSNTATAATLIPILGAIAPGLGLHPYLLVVPAAIAASCAFMLPVATPPNAIVFASGEVSIPQMIRAGMWLNLIAIVLVTLITMLLIGPIMINS